MVGPAQPHGLCHGALYRGNNMKLKTTITSIAKFLFLPQPRFREGFLVFNLVLLAAGWIVMGYVNGSYGDVTYIKYYEPHFLPNGHIVALRNASRREKGGIYTETKQLDYKFDLVELEVDWENLKDGPVTENVIADRVPGDWFRMSPDGKYLARKNAVYSYPSLVKEFDLGPGPEDQCFYNWGPDSFHYVAIDEPKPSGSNIYLGHLGMQDKFLPHANSTAFYDNRKLIFANEDFVSGDYAVLGTYIYSADDEKLTTINASIRPARNISNGRVLVWTGKGPGDNPAIYDVAQQKIIAGPWPVSCGLYADYWNGWLLSGANYGEGLANHIYLVNTGMVSTNGLRDSSWSIVKSSLDSETMIVSHK